MSMEAGRHKQVMACNRSYSTVSQPVLMRDRS